MSPKAKELLMHVAYWVAILGQLIETVLKGTGSN